MNEDSYAKSQVIRMAEEAIAGMDFLTMEQREKLMDFALTELFFAKVARLVEQDCILERSIEKVIEEAI